jgi:hypothetical protein
MSGKARGPSRRSCFINPAWLHSAGWHSRARRHGEVAEWLKAPHSKCGVRVTVPGVRIPPSPPNYQYFQLLIGGFLENPRRGLGSEIGSRPFFRPDRQPLAGKRALRPPLGDCKGVEGRASGVLRRSPAARGCRPVYRNLGPYRGTKKIRRPAKRNRPAGKAGRRATRPHWPGGFRGRTLLADGVWSTTCTGSSLLPASNSFIECRRARC